MNTTAPLDLSACDREPIHRLGAIQPVGFLIAVTRDWRIVRVSDNVADHVGREPRELLGVPLAELFERDALHGLRNRLMHLSGADAVERVFGLALVTGRRERRFDCAIHEADGLIVIEAEPSDPAEAIEAAGLLRSMIGRLDAASDLGRFLQRGARQVHSLTGFDRVMIYRFQHDGSGEVVAEVARSGIEPFLGLHYPASDIPVQARALYLRTPFRIIGDVDAVPATILALPGDSGEPLDLSLSILRAVSPVHIAYMRNMGVVASLSVSIIVDGRLWGLFACHHYSPRCPGFELRTLTELFGQMFSMRLESREHRADAARQASARQTGDRLIAAVARDVGLLGDPHWLMTMIADILPCDGVGIVLKGRIATSGVAPAPDMLPAIVRRLGEIAPGQVYATDHLRGVLPEACVAADAPAGMIAIPLSAEPEDYVMLFRRQRAQTVTWAGNPHKAVTVARAGDAAGETLSPRASFAAWREEVLDRSQPFTQAEEAVAETLRVSLIEVVLRLAGAAVAERQRANLRQEVLIAELNHRVRNILALISGLVRKSGDTAAALGDYTDMLEGRILALARAHDQITQDNWGPAPIRQLFETEGGQYLADARLTLPHAAVMLEPIAFTTLALVVHELMTNSAKYGALSGQGRVDIDWSVDDAGDLVLLWREQGGPAVQPPRRHGLGTTIIEQSIPHDLGGDAKVSYAATGFAGRFVIPARHVRVSGCTSGRADPAPHDRAAPVVPAAADDVMPPVDGPVLLVEDSMLIAIHVENMLRQMGVAWIDTAASVAAALAMIARAPPAAAILDFNLGGEDSLAVADRLRADGVPYIFATGYGEQLMLPGGHAGVPVLRKPYTRANLSAGLALAISVDSEREAG